MTYHSNSLPPNRIRIRMSSSSGEDSPSFLPQTERKSITSRQRPRSPSISPTRECKREHIHFTPSRWNPQKARKRRRPIGQNLYGRMKPLKIPSTEKEMRQQEDAYEWDAGTAFLDSTLWRIPRPLPVMASMAAQPLSIANSKNENDLKQTQNHRGEIDGLSKMPLLVSFLSDLRGNHQEESTGDNLTDNTLQKETTDSASLKKQIEPMEDASLSTLSERQHKRFLQLQHEEEESRSQKKWNEAKRKEYKKLVAAVEKEQSSYQKAVETYVDNNLHVFLVGFDDKDTRISSPFSASVALLNSKRVRQYQELWRNSNRNLTFGRCKQTISLPSQASIVHKQKHVTHLESLVVQHEVVHTCSSPESPVKTVESERFRTETSTSLLNTKTDDLMTVPPASFLRDDIVLQELVEKHNVDIVTCKETLQALLHLPGGAFTKWMIPLFVTSGTRVRSKRKKTTVAWLDLPIPQPSTPRECLTKGYESVLHHALSQSNETQSEDTLDPTQKRSIEYAYTLLTLGKTITGSATRKGIKVMVKSANNFVLDDNSAPLCLHAQLDYFVNRQEEFSSTQKAYWILDKVLQPSCRVMVGRICPFTSRLLQWEETSVAHALAQSSSASQSTRQDHVVTDPMEHWIAMVQLLNSMPMMDSGEQLLCLPGRNVTSNASTCVSVHHIKADQHQEETVVDLQHEFEQNGTAVYLGEAALKQCFQQWNWNCQDRIPRTFPIRKENDPYHQ